MLDFRIYRLHHAHALAHSWQQLRRTPVATLLTVAVLSIALLLPTILLVSLNNVKSLVRGWDAGAASISVYLKPTMSLAQTQNLLHELTKRNDISSANYISPEQGWREFAAASGLADAFVALGSNPLPALIQLKPANRAPATLQRLQTELQHLPQVMKVKLDLQWVERLAAIVCLIEKFVYGLLLILALAVLLIIGNTIRISVQFYQTEIQVLKLIGADNAFIQRPFLYSGGLYGLIAGLFTVIAISIFVTGLSIPIQKIALLYNSEFHLQGLSLAGMLILLVVSISLGLLGSWIALRPQLVGSEIY